MRLEASNDPKADCWNSSSVLRTVRRGLLSASKYRMRWFLIMLSFSSIYIWNGEQVKKRAVTESKRQKLRLEDASSRFGNDIATHCVKAVDHLVELDVKLLALDFDQTIVDVHTGGTWKNDANSLSQHLRPEMVCLIQQSLENGIYFAVTSFSQQVDLIREVVMDGIVAQAKLKDHPTTISIQGGSNYSDPKGKRLQLANAISEIKKQHRHSGIKAKKTLLIDDDKNNILLARRDGYQSLWLDPEHPINVLRTILDLTKGHIT